MYDAKVFDYIRTLKSLGRGELEITDVNNHYIQGGNMRFMRDERLVDRCGYAGVVAACQRADIPAEK